MKRFFIFIFLVFFFLYTFLASQTFAQDTFSNSQMTNLSITSTTVQNYTISTKTTINNKTNKSFTKAYLLTKILSQGKDRILEANGSKITVKDEGQLIAFSKTKPFTLSSSQTTSQETTLEYSSAIKPGDYNLIIELFDDNGTSQGVTSTQIKLSGNDTFLSVDISTCHIKIGENIFSIVEGPTIEKNQTGVFSCAVTNNTETVITAKPHVISAINSVTENITKAGDTTLSPITVGPGKTVTVPITIPNNLPGQVYEGLFTLVNFENKIISPAITFRWITTGPSAVIQSIESDKTYYDKGDTAKVSVSVKPSMDLSWRAPKGTGGNPGFSPNAGTDLVNPVLSVTISNDKNQVCGKANQDLPSTKKDVYWNKIAVNVPITADCKNPQVKAVVYEKGSTKPLATMTKTVATTTTGQTKAENIPEEEQKSNNNTIFIILGLLGITILGGGSYVIWKKWIKNKASNPPKIPPPVAVILAVITTGMIGLYSGNLSFSKPSSVEAQTRYAPFQGVVKPPNNSTDATTENLTLKKYYQRTPPAHIPPTGGNARDFAQNNTGGDSQVSVDSSCRTIQIRLNGNATSQYMCGNWGPGIAVANFVDNAPITPTNVTSPTGNFIKFPGLEVADSAFNPGNKALFGPHIFAVYTFGSAGARSAAYTLPLPTGISPGEHTLLVQVAASLSTSHAGHPDNLDRFFTSFETADLPDEYNCGGTQPCFINLTYRFRCGPRACNEQCSQDTDCAQVANGCTACVPNDAGVKVCAPPPACNAGCTRDDQCAGAKDGCTTCVPNNAGVKVCAPPPACNAGCTRDDQCAGAKDGCTACVPNNAGTGKVCAPPPACGTNCVRDDQCAGARNGCTFCTAGKCSAFSENMCSCDGMDFTTANGGETFFPGDKVTFIAYGKVPGKDWHGDASAAVNAAQITNMQFSLYQSKLTDPNNATLIAQSAAITPQIVENSATKVRYKITWDHQIPNTVPSGTLFRIQAKLTCSKKAGVLGVAVTPTPMQTNYFNQLVDTVSGIFTKGSVLGDALTPTPGPRQDQHADTYFPGAQIQEKTCTFIKFFFQ